MIDLLLFVPACFALNMAFGPNNLLSLTHGAKTGPLFALRAGVGRLAIFAPMIALSGLGLGLILSTSALLFTAIKLLGAAYLIWMGIKLLRSRPADAAITHEAAPANIANAMRHEALVAVSNPKAILIFAAFLPQFVDAAHYAQSYLVLGSVFLVLEAVAILAYGLIGRWVARSARVKLHWIQKGSGIAMVGFGLMLLFTRRPANFA